jgi:N-acetylmuramoyl-L-alanine amidase
MRKSRKTKAPPFGVVLIQKEVKPMSFKIAVGAGHVLGTAGRRIPAAMDEKQTREWQLNDRVARYVIEAAQQYEGVEVLRVDDPAGIDPISVEERCKVANKWGADFCLSIHHNAFQGKPWDGGGVTAYSCPGSNRGKQYRDAIYNAVIAAGGLRGNRANPTQTKAFIALKQTKAPAVLMEYGFMDSKVDAPIILTEEYAKAVAYATMEAIANVAGLKKKPVERLYCVQVGAFKNKDYADKMLENLKSAGFTGYITEKEN